MRAKPRVEPNRQPSLFDLDKPDEAVAPAIQQETVRPFEIPGTQILLGTSSFTASGWEGSFYPKGMKSSNYLSYYAKQFRSVEIDSTFYGTPAASTVTSWNEKTPPDFIFAVKVPQVITHEKVLVDCEPEFDEFIERMHLLGDKLGPMLSSGNAILLKTELSGKLLEWGKLKLVSSPEEADLILKVVQTGQLNLATGAGSQATVLLTDNASGIELWSKTKGGSWAMSGWNDAWVARALAKEFIKFFDSTKKSQRE